MGVCGGAVQGPNQRDAGAGGSRTSSCRSRWSSCASARGTLSARSAHPTRTAGTPPAVQRPRRCPACTPPLHRAGHARTCRSLSVACRGRRSSGALRSLRTGTGSGHHPPHQHVQAPPRRLPATHTPQNRARMDTLAQPTPPVTLVGVWTRGARPRGPGWHAGMGGVGILLRTWLSRVRRTPSFLRLTRPDGRKLVSRPSKINKFGSRVDQNITKDRHRTTNRCCTPAPGARKGARAPTLPPDTLHSPWRWRG